MKHDDVKNPDDKKNFKSAMIMYHDADIEKLQRALAEMPVSDFQKLKLNSGEREYEMMIKEKAMIYKPTSQATINVITFLIRKDFISDLLLTIETIFPEQEVILQIFHWGI